MGKRRTAIRAQALAEKIRSLNQEGLNASEIGRMVGLTASTVNHYLAGIVASPTNPEDIDKKKVVELANAGHNIYQIAKAYKVSRYIVHQILSEASLEQIQNKKESN
jgi:predicted transcriptional regulator